MFKMLIYVTNERPIFKNKSVSYPWTNNSMYNLNLQKLLKFMNPGDHNLKPEALKSLYRSPGNKKNQLVLCKIYVLQW